MQTSFNFNTSYTKSSPISASISMIITSTTSSINTITTSINTSVNVDTITTSATTNDSVHPTTDITSNSVVASSSDGIITHLSTPGGERSEAMSNGASTTSTAQASRPLTRLASGSDYRS